MWLLNLDVTYISLMYNSGGGYLVDKQKTIYVEDAETAVKIIAQARDDAKIRLQVIER